MSWWKVVTFILLVIGLGLGMVIASRTQIFKSRASNSAITVTSSNHQALLTSTQGAPVTTSRQVTLTLTSPFGASTVSFKVASSPQELDNTPAQPYSSHPYTISYTMPPGDYGLRYIWVEFTDPNGAAMQTNTSVYYQKATELQDFWNHLQITDTFGKPISCDPTLNPPKCSITSLSIMVKYRP